MAEILSFLESYQTWIYIVLGAGALIYVRSTLKQAQEFRSARFGLEQEQAMDKLRRSALMLIFLAASGIGVFIAANFVGPSLPFSARPTAVPTVSLLATDPVTPVSSEDFVAATSLPAVTPDGSGCANPNATITTPENGATLSGVVEIEGTADIENFAFYKFEFRPAGSDQVWQAISAGTETVRQGVLGSWDTSLVPASDYDFRLVVTDTTGNAPLPCQIQVRVVPSE